MNNRKIYLDYLRVLSTLAVVLIHIFTTAKTDFPGHSDIEDVIGEIIVQILHFSVPIFLMITGSLFLKKTKNISIDTLYKKYIFKYVIVLLIFGYAMAFLETIFDYGLQWQNLYRALINVLVGNTWAHMWYLYMLIGSFIMLPFVKIIASALEDDTKLRNYFLIVGVLVNFLFEMITIMFEFKIPISIPLFSNFIYYLILGELIDEKKVVLSKKTNIIGIILSLSILLITNILYLYIDLPYLQKFGGYESMVILILSMSIFAMFKNNEKVLKENKLLMFLSKYSFGTYLMHMFWINVIYKFLKISIYGNYYILKVIVVYICVIFLTYLTSFIMNKIPFIKKFV